MKRSLLLTVEILVFALGLILLPMQDLGVLAQSHDDEQQEDMSMETDETNPSGGPGEDDSTLDLGGEPPGEDYPTDDPGEDPSGEDYPTDDSEEDSSEDGHSIDESVDAAAAPGLSPQPTVPPKCRQAAGHALYLLTTSGFGGGVSHLQPYAEITFQNNSNVAFQILVTPPNIVTSPSFSVPAGSKIVIFTSATSQLMAGSIIANAGAGNMVQDIVVCP